MSLPRACIQRPVLAVVLNIALILVGIVTYSYLSLRQYPQVDRPIISVVTNYEGASPHIVETKVTKPLEAVLAGVEGLHFMTSVSEAENSRIKLHFKSNRSIDAAASDVRDRVSRVKMRLPDGAKDSTIKKSDADALPIIYIVLYSDTVDTPKLYDIAHQTLEDELEAVTGVSGVDIFGAMGYALRIWLDPVKMAAYGITTHDVSLSLRHQNVHIPAGRLVGSDREFMVTTSATLQDVNAFKDVIIMERAGTLTRLRDIATVEFAPMEERTAAYYNGKPAINMGIIKKSTANPLEIATEVRLLLPELRRKLPKNVSLEVGYDKTLYISESLDGVKRTFLEAIVCVAAIVFLFLWSFRAALIPIVTIPISVISVFTLMYFFGFSLNILTLLAIVLAIGLVVDDAIVVMENIHRYMEKGMSPKEASIKGVSEISFAVVAMTLTLAAVYAPIALAQGMIGKLFTEFALTLAGAVLISGFAALTISPMMCSRFLRPIDHSGDGLLARGQRVFEYWYGHLESKFKTLLSLALMYRLRVLIVAVVFFLVGSLIGIKGLQSELAPKEDQGVIRVSAMLPQSATLEYTKRYLKDISDIFDSIPEVESQLSIVAPPNPMFYQVLKPWSQRSRTSMEIIKEIRSKLRAITGMHVFASPGSTLIRGGGASDESLQFVLQTTQETGELDSGSELLEYMLRKSGVLPLLNTDRGEDMQEYVIDVDREKASLLGVEVSTIGETFDTFISGRRITDFRRDNEQFDVIAQVRNANRRSADDLSHMYVRSADKKAMVPLSNLVTVRRESIPTQVNHYNQLRSVTLSGELGEGISLGTAVAFLKETSDKVLPDSIRTDFTGETKQYIEAQNTIYLIFGLAIIFIYLVMAAQFESFKDPFIIMLSVPLSLSGALITLKCTGGTLSIYSQIGLITLIGLITKHGILIVEFANQLRDKDITITASEAILKATALRLRPILITTAAMVLGAIPLIMASGAGMVSRKQIGWVIFGGMCIGTLFTLFVIPIVYSLLAKNRKQRV